MTNSPRPNALFPSVIEVDDVDSPEAQALLAQGIAVIGPWVPPRSR